jgi:hypothetical protein
MAMVEALKLYLTDITFFNVSYWKLFISICHIIEELLIYSTDWYVGRKGDIMSSVAL